MKKINPIVMEQAMQWWNNWHSDQQTALIKKHLGSVEVQYTTLDIYEKELQSSFDFCNAVAGVENKITHIPNDQEIERSSIPDLETERGGWVRGAKYMRDKWLKEKSDRYTAYEVRKLIKNCPQFYSVEERNSWLDEFVPLAFSDELKDLKK